MPSKSARVRFVDLALLVLLCTPIVVTAQPIVDIQVRFVTVGNPFFDDIGVKFDIPPDQQVQIEAQIVFVRMGTVPGFGFSGDFGSNDIIRVDSVFPNPPGTLLCDTDPSSTFYGCSGATTNPPDTMHAVFNITGVGIGEVTATINAFAIGDPDTTNNVDTAAVVVTEASGLSRISGAVYLDRVGFNEAELAIGAGTSNPMTGVVVDLLDEGGTLLEQTTTTSNGYSFDVVPGTYQVRQNVPEGTYRTFPFNPDTYTVTVGEGRQIVNVDFVNTPLVTISGQKIEDVDRDFEINDPDDVGLNGWTIRLEGTTIAGERVVLETVTSDKDIDGDGVPEMGVYEFRVPPGQYNVDEVPQPGFENLSQAKFLPFGYKDPPRAIDPLTAIRYIFDTVKLRNWEGYHDKPELLQDRKNEKFVNWRVIERGITVSENGSEVDEAIRECNQGQTDEACEIDIEEVIMKTSSGRDGVISLQNPLPVITAPMIINGGGATLDGSLLDDASGFVVSGVGAVIRDFTITNFDGHGIVVLESGHVQVDSSTVANNGGAGIRVAEGASASIVATAIHANGGLAIDLDEEGSTPNDDDVQTPNKPNITSVDTGDTLFVNVSYQGADTSRTFFQVFTSSECGSEESGQGEFLLGGFEARTDSMGNIDMVLVVDTTFSPKRYLSLTATDFNGNTSEFSPCDESVATDVERDVPDPEAELPSTVRFLATYPNPFRDRVTIQFQVTSPQPVRVEIIDVLGRVVASPLDETRTAGTNALTIDVRSLPPGIYFARISGPGWSSGQKMIGIR